MQEKQSCFFIMKYTTQDKTIDNKTPAHCDNTIELTT